MRGFLGLCKVYHINPGAPPPHYRRASLSQELNQISLHSPWQQMDHHSSWKDSTLMQHRAKPISGPYSLST